ncbi:hypothetical protein HPB51_000226 [Rhipicephalus microplus]|uniref:Secreted protein n=1 Tax=Rhipicephalus microplus TaxID=6941 RepID=A0A9J6EVR9_RHIMP|nr:hypothetical protein HPB51_000226 [Rhipicephalus microplus]
MLPVTVCVCIFFAAAFAEECSKVQLDDATMKEAGEVATKLMKECVHLLDKYPTPISTIADGMKLLCDDYATCHDKHESLTSKPDDYRKELIKCVQPHFLKFYKSRPELKHDPEQVGKEISNFLTSPLGTPPFEAQSSAFSSRLSRGPAPSPNDCLLVPTWVEPSD